MIHKNGRVWRYVRASMSLQGYLPPLCDTDPATGKVNLLLDGGYVSNLPVEAMRDQGAAFIIAVDVAGVSEGGHYDYGDSLSGWWWLWQKVKYRRQKCFTVYIDLTSDFILRVAAELTLSRYRYRPLFIPIPWSKPRPKVLTMGELAAELSYCADYLRKEKDDRGADLVFREFL